MRIIPFGKPLIGELERAAVMEVLAGTTLVHGPRASEFETRFAAFTGAAHAVAVGSCTAGLHLAYLARGIGPGDEVIVPAQTHVATAHAVEMVGARPVFVDADPATGNIDLDAIEAAITPRTRALSVVHYLGLPVDMDRVRAIADRHQLFVVEDCALAIGTRLRGRHAGTLGDVGCFSFYPVKHMTTGEGGMVTTNDAALAERIRRQRAFGLDRTVTERAIPGIYDVTMLGYNYRMNEMAAALGIVQLGRVPDFLATRRRNDTALRQALASEERITFLPVGDEAFMHSRYCAVAILHDDIAPKRFEIVQHLKEHGVGTSVYYPKPVPHLAYYRQKYGYGDTSFPNAARISRNGIALPVGPHLTEEDAAYIATTFRAALDACAPQSVTVSLHVPSVPARTISLTGRRIALIGGAGFIGHHLALALRQQGAQVDIIDSLQVNNVLAIASDGTAEHRPLYTRMLNERFDLLRDAGIPLHVQDARDYHALCQLLSSIQPQVIVQLAAVAHANRSNKDPHTTFDHSLRTLENALDYARFEYGKGTLDQFVFFSSSMVYGNFPNGIASEETSCSPLGIYGALKRAGELIVQSYHQVFGLPYTIVRPSALYGERCVSRRVGQIFIENAMAGRDIVVQGDGSDRLDFTCVHDLVHGIQCVLTHPEAKNETFNLTYGAGRSIAELAEVVGQEFPDIRVRYEPKDALTPDRGTLDITKARRMIGYDPQYPIERGLARYIAWYRMSHPTLSSIHEASVPSAATRIPA